MKNSWSLVIQFVLSIGVLLFLASCGAPKVASSSQPIDHAIWDSLLRKHVDDLGLIDYRGFKEDSLELRGYLDLLENNHPNDQNWSEAEQMAYWINAYNAFTVELIVDHYPVTSIKDIKNGVPFVNTVWDIKFIAIEGEIFDLNNIEHGILRKDFDDPRIHFALVCASLSCPKLLNRAFTPGKLDQQLDQAASAFLEDPFRNGIERDPIHLSKILDWYWMDFKDSYAGRYELINQYTTKEVAPDAKIEFLDYDWSLNEQSPGKRAMLQGE